MSGNNSPSTIGFMALIVYAVVLIAVLAASFSAFWRYNNEISKKSEVFYQENILLLSEIKEDLTDEKNKFIETAKIYVILEELRENCSKLGVFKIHEALEELEENCSKFEIAKIYEALGELKENCPKFVVAKTSKALVKQEESHQKFMADYYKSQSDWLNRWLTVLGMILALMGIMAPLLLIRYNAEKKRDFERLEDQMNQTHNKMKEVLKKAEKAEQQAEEAKEQAEEAEKKAKLSELISEGNSLVAQKRYSEAIVTYNDALQIYPQNAAILLNLGACYYALKNFERAIVYFNQALLIGTPLSVKAKALTNLGVIYLNYENYDVAIRLFKGLLEIEQDVAVLYNIVSALLYKNDINDLEDALKYLRAYQSKSNYILCNDKEKWLKILIAHTDDGFAKEIINIINDLEITENKFWE